MKAITCTQCGALVKKILLKEKFAHCDYCGAKILLSENEDKIVEIPDKEEKKLTPWEQHQENYRKMRERVRKYDDAYINPTPDKSPQLPLPIFLALFVGLAIIGFLVSQSKGCFYRPLGDNQETIAKNGNLSQTKSSTPTPTPLPKINYDVKVDWDGWYLNYDMEHYERPEIEIAKLPTFNEDELKKTVFKVRNVQVKITINTDGEVSSAEAITGHPILQDAALKAAKKSLFKPRSKPTNRILTYYFRLITE